MLSSNENPTNVTPIASVTAWTTWRDFTEEPSQQSALIYLQGGQRYYLEALMEQGTGGDNLSVQWELPNGTLETPLATASAAGTLLIPFTGSTNLPGIYLQPTNTTAIENDNITFSLLVTNQSSVSYQWHLGTTNLPGATTSILTLTNLSLSLNGRTFSCVVSNASGSVTSAPVTLTVNRDTNPPTVVRAFNMGATNVAIVYSKLVNAASATNVANYAFTNGLAVTGATLNPDGATVILATDPLVYGSNYSIVINRVNDLANIPNTIATNTTVTFQAMPFVPYDIGNPSMESTVIFATNGLNVTTEGGDFGGTTDQGNLSYQIYSGNFDVCVRVADLGLSDIFAKAGLMARETLTNDGRFAASFATPAMNGTFFEWRDPAGSTASKAGDFPANYPNTWLRLQRVGNTFAGYAGYDGQTWTELGSDTISMSNQVYLGFAVSSDNTNQTTTAQFLDFASVTNAVIGTQINPHEAIGPSSRLSPIVFSEIMWKPAPRTDGKNLEFLEIYNSNPWFQDISSYQITCADMNYTFPAGTTIPGGGYLVIAAVPADIESVYGITNVMGPYAGSLKHSETLELLDEQTNVLLTVPYTDVYPWPVADDGTGHSMVLANPTYGEGDPRAWDISDVVGGSPGQMDGFTPSPLCNVVINEILPHSENPAVPQFIELYNHSTNTVDISGCILTDDPTTNKFVVPPGTTIGPAGFVSFTQPQFGFTLNGQGETLYFIKPDGSRVLDAVQFGAQADGVSYGRRPDGANDFYAFTTNTPGTNNSSILIGDIVINELMYNPISGNDDDQYIELYNKGTNSINLSGWQFTSGVTFTFPANTVISPNGYVVVGKNIDNLFASYTNLNSSNTYGNYSGKLSHNGELVVLAQPESFFGTNTIYVEEDEVAYGTGGRWGEWSSGSGSSLELIDPHSNHRLAANWADSDDTSKSVWTNITYTGVLDNGSNYDATIDYAQIGILDEGECLVDNIEVNYNGVNYVLNSNFNGGTLNNWTLQGDHVRSSLENSGYNSSYSLHIRCSDKFWDGDDSCQMALAANTLAAGKTVTLGFETRWLHGWPEALLRLNGNWLEATGPMPVPNNLGSPGMPNSTYLTNAGPAIYNVTHNPPVPAASQSVVVTANVSDPDGVQTLTLYYRLDPATTYTAVTMKDNGTGGDAVPGDGVFSATIPGQAANQIAAFYISATDSLGASTRFPALRPNDNEPVRECVVMFGDSNPGGSFGVYHLWLTQTNVTRWANLGNLSNEGNDCTMVSGNRVFYNIQGHFAGSPYHQDFDTPYGALCHYKWEFNDDDKFLGATDFNKIHQPGNGPGDDASLQREQLANTLLRTLGVPWLNRRYVAVFVNGNRRGYVMEDTQVPNGDLVKEHYPNDPDGFLYKMQPWFEFAPQLSGEYMNFDNQSWCNLMPYITTGGILKRARYRYNFEIRRTPDSFNDFTNVFSLIEAANSYGTPNYVANMENLANMENWMRVFAANHAAGNWDSFGAQNGQNLYGYIGTLGTKYSLLMWDFNIVIGSSASGSVSWGPGQDLFTLNSQDTNMANIYNTPVFLRMYWRALQELVNGPLDVTNSGPLLMAKYNAFTKNGFSVENPTAAIEPWLSEAQSSIASQLAAVNTTNFSVSPNVTFSNDVAYVTGQAPVNVDFVWINGVAYPLTWTTLTNWVVTVPLLNGTNSLSVVGVGTTGQPISGDSNNLSVVYTGTNTSPVGQVVINEIMYNPPVAGAQFVELHNNSTNATFDLSGWQLQALSYTCPAGSTIAPAGYLVLAQNGAAFDAAYGATNPVFDIFSGTLAASGTLVLTTSNNVTVAEVAYENRLPWPTNADGAGASLQLIDPRQNNWRVGNWAAVLTTPSATPGTHNSVAASLPPFPSLWINELQADNLTGVTNSAGQHAPWLELYNPGTNAISLSGLYLANNYTNLLQWAFPSNAVINAGQFEVIFADGLTNLSTTNELHAGFILPASSGSLALSRLYESQPQVFDYIDYTNLPPNYSCGSFPDGQSFVRQQFFYASPGAANNAEAPSIIPYFSLNSLYTQNFDSLPDPGTSTVDSEASVTIAGITYTPANPLNFAAPVSSGGLGLPLTMPGWYGLASEEMKFGASAGDQSTGGVISFGPTTSAQTNRALGLLATSTTGTTAFGVGFINLTTNIIDQISLSYTGELWRQQPSAKSLSFSYYIDPTATNAFSTNETVPLPALDVNFPTGAFTPEDGTQPANQIPLGITGQTIVQWPPGAALWMVWQMTNNAGTSQGLAIDNLSFSANSLPLPPLILSQPQSQIDFAGSTATLSVSANGASALSYQWQCNGTNIPGATGSTLSLSALTATNAGTYTVKVTDATGITTSQGAVLTVVTHSAVAYTTPGAVYTQNFDSLPDPGATTVNSSDPVTINNVTYSVASPLDFGFPAQTSGAGGLGLFTTMPGWYGAAATAIKLGAQAGDQTTGGIISFGATNSASANRALGLLATSTTGATAFGVRILNQTVNTLTNMTLSFTGELWRQQTTAKTLAFSYYVDPTGTAGFSTANVTATLPALNVSFSTGAQAAGGTGPLMTSTLGVTNQLIGSCSPGSALWLMWQMTSAAGSAQGLAIDNLSFSATGPETVAPILSISPSQPGITVSWQAGITNYTLQCNSNLSNTNGWQSMVLTNTSNIVTLPMTNEAEFYRLKQ